MLISRKQLNEVLTRYFEFTLPSYGLGWVDAERIARIYMLLGKHDPSKRYFLYAAKMKDEIDTKRDTREPHYVFYISSIHVGLLYSYASNQSKALEMFNRVKDDILSDFEPTGGNNSKRTRQLSALILANLFLEKYEEIASIITELRKTNPEEAGILEIEKLDVIEKLINAYKHEDVKTASLVLRQYKKKLIEINDDPISAGAINNFDILLLLEKICNRTKKNSGSYP